MVKQAALLGISVCLWASVFCQSGYKVAIIGFYNLENLYDTIDNPIVNDDEFTPDGVRNYNGSIYTNKLSKLASVIARMGSEISPDGPAILGVAEIENDTVLHDLVKHPLIRNRNYRIVHYDSKDLRGVDVALLYNPAYFTVTASGALFVDLPEGAKTSFFTRDVLWVKGRLDGETIYVFVNHWPSRLGGEERSAPGRYAAAQVNRNFIDSVKRNEPNAKFVIMGDLNDDPVNKSVTQVLGAKGKQSEVKPGELFNPWYEMYKKGIGTLAYQDAWGLFDQIIISQSWLEKQQKGFFYYRQHIFNKEFIIENIGKYKGYPMRTWDGNTYRGGYSDHFPTYLVMLKQVQ